MDIIVKDSKIHGKGVFANRDFDKGEVVIRWILKQINKTQFEELTEEEKQFISFKLLKERKYFLIQPPARFVNHSHEPNTTSGDNCDIAIKQIKKGEEITSYYPKNVVSKDKLKCNCGSKNCKGIIE